MKIFLNAFSYVSLLAFVSCASKQEARISNLLPGPDYGFSEINRSPAAKQEVPYAPGNGRKKNGGHTTTTPPAAPETSAPANGNPPVAEEAAASCPVPLNRIPVGGRNRYGDQFSVMDILVGASNYGTFTGDFEADRRILAPWFGGLATPGSDIDQVLKDSKPWCRALQFVRGYPTNQCGAMQTPDVLINAKMAAVMVAFMSVRNQPECVREVRELAYKVLRENSVELDEKDIPLLESAKLIADGRLGDKFEEIEKSRHDIEKEISSIDATLAKKERDNKELLRKSKDELKDHYNDLRLALARIPPCSSTVKISVLLASSDEKVDAFTSKLVDECKSKIQGVLDRARDDQVEATRLLAEYAERHKNNPEMLRQPREDELEVKLADSSAKIDIYKGYLDLLVNRDADRSVAFHKEKLDATFQTGMAAQKAVKTQSYSAEDLKKKKELEQRYRSFSTRYLTYGYFGAFGNLAIQ